jgi:hypothetical protein
LIFLFLSSLSAALLAAGPCPISKPIGFEGIGDGCTVTLKGYPVAPPDIYVFQSLFTPACNGHDACYSSLGGTYDLCDNKFLADARGACRSKFSPWFPVELAACYSTAQNYYYGIAAARGFSDIASLQRDALIRLNTIRAKINAMGLNNKCSTAPEEQTNLFTPELIGVVAAIFSNAVGRGPTIYEFVEAVAFGGDSSGTPLIFSNYANWEAQATAYAATRRAFPVATNVAVRNTGYSFTLPNPTSGAVYSWGINGAYGSGTTFNVPIPEQPLYDTTFVLIGSGYGANGYGENRNIATILRYVTIKGSCAPRKGLACL